MIDPDQEDQPVQTDPPLAEIDAETLKKRAGWREAQRKRRDKRLAAEAALSDDGGSEEDGPEFPPSSEEVKEPKSKLAAPKRPRGPAPSRNRARVSLDGLVSGVLALGGQGLIMSGRDVPVGQALAFEAPVAGQQLDKIIAGTWVDKLLQPVARAGGVAKDVGSVMALPLLVALIERRPYLYGPLRPLIYTVVTDVAVSLAEIEERNKSRLKEAQAKAGGAEINVDQLVEALFGAQQMQAAPVPSEVPVAQPAAA